MLCREVYQERERLKGIRHNLLAMVAQPQAAAVPDAQQTQQQPDQLQQPGALSGIALQAPVQLQCCT